VRRRPKLRVSLVATGIVVAATLALWLGVGLHAIVAFLLVATTVTFAFYAADKARARHAGARVPEVTLLGLSLGGGAIGGGLAMLLLRHKTRHTRFWTVNLVGLAVPAYLAARLLGIGP
jgi:uncharacterized membrane protein YsdA (DUF1294 family)